MLFKVALVLLALWVIGLFGVYDVGQLVHALLLAGLMLLVLAFLHARDAALRRIGGDANKTS
jgi:hypothetical protein